MNRLSFNIPDGGPLDSMANMITMDQIMRAVVVEVNETYNLNHMFKEKIQSEENSKTISLNPVFSLLVVAAIVLLVCLATPVITFMQNVKQSVVERLRQN